MIIRTFEAEFPATDADEAYADAKAAIGELPWTPDFQSIGLTKFFKGDEPMWVATAKANGKEF